MHESLRTRNISQLPKSLKKLAYAAEKGSSIDLLHLIQAAKEEPASESRCLLPVFYANLHAVAMPTVEMLENGPDEELAVDPVRRVLMSLKGLSELYDNLLLPPDTYEFLWPRVFPWLDFFTTYSDYYPQLLKDNIKYPLHFELIWILLRDPMTAAMIKSTRGVRSMVARAWADFLDSNVYSSSSRIFGILCEVIRTLFDASDPDIVQEINTGCGPNGLAFVIVKHMLYVLPSAPEIMEPDTTMCFGIALRMVIDLADSTPAMIPALLSHGIVPALVRTICAFEWEHIAELFVSMSMRTLLRLLKESSDHRPVVDALRAGLLKAIVSSIPMEIEHVLELLTCFLPAHAVHHTVLAHLRRLPPALDKIVKTFDPAVRQTPHFAAWMMFCKLVIEREDLQMSLDLVHPSHQLACDNMACGKISARTSLMRCSGCRSTSYCSAECQRRDWKEGGHRAECMRRNARRLDESDGALTSRDRQFLRELLHHDYETQRPEIIRRQLDFVEARGAHLTDDGWVSFYTSFNYTIGRAEITVLPLNKLSQEFRDDYLPRLSRSGGRMELHEAVFLQGGKTSSVLFLMRSSQAYLQRALRVLHDPAAPEVDRRRRELLGRIEDSTELASERTNEVDIHLSTC
ncbi:hypothetical protein FB451DRAFT_358513 [Mycena latifolia]|nr:hypothetical protein FB451DRAFT_358513 [Mycena latifolia]